MQTMSPKMAEMPQVHKNLEACTDEELLQRLAAVLAHASGEVLNEAEVRNFYKLCEELRRRAPAVQFTVSP